MLIFRCFDEPKEKQVVTFDYRGVVEIVACRWCEKLNAWCDIGDTKSVIFIGIGLGFFLHGAKVLRPEYGSMELSR